MLIKRLQELGFKEADCVRALQATSGRLEVSATWLLENATPVIQVKTVEQQGGAQGWQFAGFEVCAACNKYSAPNVVESRSLANVPFKKISVYFPNWLSLEILVSESFYFALSTSHWLLPFVV